ncbi:MAG: hypothetical protein AAGF12_31030 [Myxococcota bacterium]
MPESSIVRLLGVLVLALGCESGLVDDPTSDASAPDGTSSPDATHPSNAAGADATPSDATLDAEAAPASTEIPVVVGLGWQGLRVLSLDEGETWCETGLMTDPHDDLFRGGGYHDGLFVGAHAGAQNQGAIWTSRNGYEWTPLHRTNEDPQLPENPSRQWYGGAAFGNGVWMAAGGCGRLARSSDGVAWESVDRFTDGCLHIRSLAFCEGRFVAALDDDHWYSSTDGSSWQLYQEGAGSFVVALPSGLSGAIDGNRFYQGRGVCLAGRGSPNFEIIRSTRADCREAARVASTPHRVTTFLFGAVDAAEFARPRLPETLADCLGRD